VNLTVCLLLYIFLFNFWQISQIISFNWFLKLSEADIRNPKGLWWNTITTLRRWWDHFGWPGPDPLDWYVSRWAASVWLARNYFRISETITNDWFIWREEEKISFRKKTQKNYKNHFQGHRMRDEISMHSSDLCVNNYWLSSHSYKDPTVLAY
jgi:hypothetical protein